MFEGLDAVTLARAQFAFTMSFHIVFPAFSIGLASYLAVLEARWLLTGREVFLNLFTGSKSLRSPLVWAWYRAS
jgi:cytochrome bd ubiquinol oxidase subunit I